MHLYQCAELRGALLAQLLGEIYIELRLVKHIILLEHLLKHLKHSAI